MGGAETSSHIKEKKGAAVVFPKTTPRGPGTGSNPKNNPMKDSDGAQISVLSMLWIQEKH